jgi:hypothetical protein
MWHLQQGRGQPIVYSMMVGAQTFCNSKWPAAYEARVLATCFKVVAAKLLAEVPQTAGRM